MDVFRQAIQAALHGEVDGFSRLPRSLPLFLHAGIKSGHVHGNALLFGNLLGQFQRKAVGVVKGKGIFANNLLRLLCQQLGQELLSPLQGFQKVGFLPLQFCFDRGGLFPQGWIGIF